MAMKKTPFVLWNAAAAAAATEGDATGEWRATGVSIDTRTLVPGDLFVAIRGVASDGHDFAKAALEKGAAGVVVRRGFAGVPDDAPGVRVDDTLQALEALGRTARDRSRAKICAVTGSVGKTGSKEALALILERQGVMHASQGNLNNHWGLPLSLARMPVEAQFGVFEMGMNHPGEIRPLSQMARPHVALITTVELVHSEYFQSVEEIADAKAEIFDGLVEGGTAVLNRDNPMFDRLSAAARRAGAGEVVSFGKHAEADVRVIETRPDAVGTSVLADVSGAEMKYRVGVPGRHWVINTLGVLAAAKAMGADMDVAAAMLARIAPPKGRGNRLVIPFEEGELTVIDESYNASPVAVAAAIEVLGMSEPGAGGRRIAVLGDMLELGEKSDDLHRSLAGPLTARNVDAVFTAGSGMGGLFDDLPRAMRGGHAVTSDKLAPLVASAVRPGDVVLVKGSYGSRMGVVVDALTALGRSHERPNGGRGRAVNGE
ncbi:MAG: UDP-N-acetylmuramoylalanyl-D-glutamyl-2, 6-diaminopimelate--D-alanyl-D-alanine ligase [Rhodospirillales bacterium CG15_BIG_FIL_POST_REV_8_21_14_020_66_15]|nr:MAG: UDP-N-acetylmuramoylalanyl-D-glutamyl-2, 6-diaminopimelate--D-alanyl-D-alanine ligase [Rhodospirillales bacterium CG15_BIG_FIL_POST_REV_8_21_14_020_66_15]